jgi:hypothetical protein
MEDTMKNWWNFLAVAGCLLTLVAFFSYYFVFARFPATRDFPWPNLLLFGGGLYLAAKGLGRSYRHPQHAGSKVSSTLLAVLSVLVVGLFVTENLYLSAQLPPSKEAPKVGQKAPDFTLEDTKGRQVTLAGLVGELAEKEASLREKQLLLLVFYRGYW